jgi:hypothetical protein
MADHPRLEECLGVSLDSTSCTHVKDGSMEQGQGGAGDGGESGGQHGLLCGAVPPGVYVHFLVQSRTGEHSAPCWWWCALAGAGAGADGGTGISSSSGESCTLAARSSWSTLLFSVVCDALDTKQQSPCALGQWSDACAVQQAAAHRCCRSCMRRRCVQRHTNLAAAAHIEFMPILFDRS